MFCFIVPPQKPFRIVAEGSFHGSRTRKTEKAMEKAIITRCIQQRRTKQNFIQNCTNAPLINDWAEMMFSQCNFWCSIR